MKRKIVRFIRGKAVNDLVDEAEENNYQSMKNAIEYVNSQGIISGCYLTCAVIGGTAIVTCIGVKAVSMYIDSKQSED